MAFFIKKFCINRDGFLIVILNKYFNIEYCILNTIFSFNSYSDKYK